jgi:PAS domain S-box-containing protein
MSSVLISLQIVLIIMSILMLRITVYRVIWILSASAATLIIIRVSIIQTQNRFTSEYKFAYNIIPVLVSILVVTAFIIFYNMYKTRLKMESAIRKEEMNIKNNLITLSTAVEQSPSIVVITDLQGNIEYTNPKFTEITGYTKSESIGKNQRFLKSGNYKKEVYEELWTSISSGGEWRGVFHNKKKNGDLYWESASISSIKDIDGNIMHYLAVKEDITEKKRIEDALIKSEERLKNVQQLAGIGTWEWNNIKQKAYWSNENYRILGFEPESIEPSLKLFQSLIHPEDRERVKRSSIRSRAEHTDNNTIFRLLLKDGSVKYVNDWSQYFFNSQKELQYSTGMMQDITQRVENEENIKNSLKEKEALLRELHHRTKNNMQVIISIMNLNSSKIDDKRISTVFNDINNRIQSMSLVHEKLYKSENLSRINLSEYIAELCSSLKGSYSNNCNVEFKLDLESISVLIDAAIPLGLIITELISNSFKYAFPENKNGEIFLSLKNQSHEKIKIVVSDNGIGPGNEFDINNLESIGLQTIILIAERQLQGKVEFDISEGFKFILVFDNNTFTERV